MLIALGVKDNHRVLEELAACYLYYYINYYPHGREALPGKGKEIVVIRDGHAPGSSLLRG
jgi:hypothetical protein